MFITLKTGYRATSTVVDALSEAGKFTRSDGKRYLKNGKGWKSTIWLNGREFYRPKDAVEFMLGEINEWMLGCNLVDTKLLKRNFYQGGRDCPFDFTGV
jgi:hypothetical protein